MGGRKKSKKFKPFKNYRYLPGSVLKNYNDIDLRAYNKHRYVIFTASPIVDTKPFKLNPLNWMRTSKLRADTERTITINKENKRLLARINIINRTKGSLDTYNPAAYLRYDFWKAHENEMRIIERNNRLIYGIVSNVTSYYNNKQCEKEWQLTVKTMRHIARFPFILTSKIEEPEFCSISPGLKGNPETRQWCFLDFRVINGEHIGRIYFELYNDFVPITVHNFLSICQEVCGLSYKNCKVHRIVQKKYLETGDITHGTGKGGWSIYGQTFPEEGHVLKHTRPGVLAMKKLPSGIGSQFIISLDEVQEFDKKNVVFGCMVSGYENLMKFNGYARKIGKPFADIYICDCGEVTRNVVEKPTESDLITNKVKIKNCKCLNCPENKKN